MILPSDRAPRQLLIGAMSGAAAWSAYAVADFLSSSVLFRLVRPYAVFTPWHWHLTAILTAAYLIAGALCGALAGLAVMFLARRMGVLANPDTTGAVEGAAALTLVAAFGTSLVANPYPREGKYFLVGVTVVFAGLLMAAIRSSKWAKGLGFLTSPWVFAGVMLGIGQGFSLLQLQEIATQLGASTKVWAGALILVLGAVILGAIMLGRRLKPHLARDRFSLLAPDRAALVLALSLLVGSAWLSGDSPALAESPAPAAAPSGKTNVVLVVMDTVRADHLSVYGYERDTTPNLKKLAGDAVVFTRATSAADITLSSHASLFTGTYASWHGAHCQPPEAAFGRALGVQYLTLAQMLGAKGYSTLGVSANLYLRADFGLQRGFQTFRIPRPVPLAADENWYMLRKGMRRVINRFVDTSQFDRLYARSEDVNKELFSLLNKRPAGAPFFAFLNYMDAHYPYIPPAPYDALFPGKNRAIQQENLDETNDKVVGGEPMPAGDLRHSVSQYDGGITYEDAQIGQLVEWLKQRNLYDNTMIVVTSDHGEAFGEKNLVLHGNSAYQNLLHTVLLVKMPGGTHAGVVSEMVSLVDVAPTILTTLGLPVPKNVQGRSLLERGGERQILGESFPCPVLQGAGCKGCLTRALISWPYKLIQSSNGKRELFDLAADPGETRNLMKAEDSKTGEMAAELSRWVKSIPPQSKQRLQLDGEALQRLKSLGYVQ